MLFIVVATSPMWLWTARYLTSETKEMHGQFYLASINLNLNSMVCGYCIGWYHSRGRAIPEGTHSILLARSHGVTLHFPLPCSGSEGRQVAPTSRESFLL
jgi:hypothetical protein